MTIIITVRRYRRRNTSAQSEPKRTNDAAEEWFAVGPRVADWPVGPTPRGPRHGPRTDIHTHTRTYTYTERHLYGAAFIVYMAVTVVGGWWFIF